MTTPDIKKLIAYWREEAEHSWSIVPSLFEKKNFPESLFFAHLTLEKLLKALVVHKTQTHAPLIHDLARLSDYAKIVVTREQKEDLKLFSEFYMAGRYDEQKMTFRKKCTVSFTQKNLDNMKTYYLWLKKLLSQALSNHI